jgi:hypothetical protein
MQKEFSDPIHFPVWEKIKGITGFSIMEGLSTVQTH